MIQFEYDDIMKRYNVLVPFTLAGESSKTTVASISEDNRITLHRELRINLVRQILLNWDEYEHLMTRELDELLDDSDKLAKSIDELELTVRSHNCLQHRGIRTVGQLVKKKASDLIKFRYFGRKSLTEIEERLNELGLTLKQ